MSPKVKLALNILATVISAGGWLPFWLGWVWYEKWHASKVSNYQQSEAVKKIKFEIGEMNDSLSHHSALENSLAKLDTRFPNKGMLVKIPAARLYESRAGASITSTSGTLQAQTKTGTIGIGTKLGPIGVGLGASQGETRGSIDSSSITRAGKDEMTLIDRGDFILSVESIAFAGQQFARSVDYSNLLNWQVSKNEILISSKNSEKNWLVALNSDSVVSLLGKLIEHLASLGDSLVDSDYGNSVIETLKTSNQKELESLTQQLAQKNDTLMVLEAKKQDPFPISIDLSSPLGFKSNKNFDSNRDTKPE
jgi:hypothetical protein